MGCWGEPRGFKKPMVFDHGKQFTQIETKHGKLKAKRHGLKNFDSAKHMKKDTIQLTQAGPFHM